jgi:hypothetical protein
VDELAKACAENESALNAEQTNAESKLELMRSTMQATIDDGAAALEAMRKKGVEREIELRKERDDALEKLRGELMADANEAAQAAKAELSTLQSTTDQ